MRLVFLHGGPGLNGNPERQLLAETYADAGVELAVWHEPSALRSTGALQPASAWAGWSKSAADFVEAQADEGPVVLLAHSFGAWAAWELAREHPSRVRHVVYVAPGLSPAHDQKNTLTLVRDAFDAAGDEARAGGMAARLAAYSGAFDDNAVAAWTLALECPQLFDGYWHDRAAMAEYLALFDGDFAVDMASFFSVSASRPPVPPRGVSEVPATVIWGAHERIVERAVSSAAVRERHAQCVEVTLDGAAHYPHIERRDEVLRIVAAL